MYYAINPHHLHVRGVKVWLVLLEVGHFYIGVRVNCNDSFERSYTITRFRRGKDYWYATLFIVFPFIVDLNLVFPFIVDLNLVFPFIVDLNLVFPFIFDPKLVFPFIFDPLPPYLQLCQELSIVFLV